MRWGGNDWDKYGKKLQKQVAFYETTCFCWSEMGDSNSRHLAPKASALPTALIPDLGFEFCARCGQTCGQAVFLTTSTCGGSACIAGVSRDCGHGIFRLEGGATRSQSKRATNCANPGYEIQTDPTAGCSNSGVCLQMATPQNLTAVHVACRKRTECRRKTILYFTEICRKVKSYIEEAPCLYGHGALILATAAAIAATAVVAAAPTAAAAAAPDDDQQNDDPAAVPAASATVITAHIGTSYEIEM